MRKTILFVLGMMLIGAGVAQAGEKEKNRERSQEFRCRFLGSDLKKDAYGQCEAWGRICRREHNGPNAENERRECRNHLAVTCNGQPIYNDGARFEDSHDFDFLIGRGGVVSLKFHRSEHSERSRDDSTVRTAWLNVYGSVLNGFCAFEKEHHNEPKLQ